MTEAIETRRLAAVMFADIEGYTSMFQRNEVEALALIKMHREHLQGITAQHHGQIVKYYGDGSLTVFNSLIEAVRCAADLQRMSAEHQVRLRIGIHMGEMLERENDMYGDAVNIASRIQTLGVAGSILVSKIVADEIKNHPDLQTKSIGQFRLKNVKEPTEVFAVTEKGTPFPLIQAATAASRFQKKHLLLVILGVLLLAVVWWNESFRKKFGFTETDCIIIPPFISNVSSPEFQFFPQFISSLLSKRLAESTNVEIVNPVSGSYYTNADMASISANPSMAKSLGAKYIIQGNFALEGPEEKILRIWMSFIDPLSGKSLPIHIPDITCNATDKMDCVQHAADILAGYWKSYKDYLFQYTNDSAYTAFAIAQEKWADPGADSLVKAQLLKAIAYDPQFLDAWFLLMDYFHNHGQIANGLDTLSAIRAKFPTLTQRQQDYLGYYEFDFQNKNLLTFQSFYKEYKRNQKDLFINTTGMVMALEYLNHPALALRLFHQIEPDRIDLAQCTYCLTRFNIALKAYLELKEMEKAAALASRIKPYASKRNHFLSLLRYYVKARDTVSVNDVIRLATNHFPALYERQFFTLTAGRFAAINRDTTLMAIYGQQAAAMDAVPPLSIKARCYMLLNRWSDAEKILTGEIQKSPTDPTLYGYLGVVYARQHKKQEAELMLRKLGELDFEFLPGEKVYYQGRIKANLMQFDEALRYFTMAFDQGIRFLPNGTFQNDPDMVLISSYKPYLELITQFRHQKFE